MRIISDLPEHDMTPAATERWYDRSTRCWIVTTVTKHGFQVGDATYVHSKREALLDENRRKADIKELIEPGH